LELVADLHGPEPTLTGVNEVEFADPRLVAAYDDLNPYEPGTQPDFYAALAAENGAEVVVELGCGTGLVACALARPGVRVIGVEPSAAMLARARARNADVEWIAGDAAALGTPNADLAIMSGHVAQFFVTDAAWSDALAALHRALRPGGHLAFEARDPVAREWEQWIPANARTVATGAGTVEQWIEVDDVRDGIVAYRNCYRFVARDEEVVSPGRLRFRTRAELTQSLIAAGFAVDAIYGDWDRRPVSADTRELIVMATRLSSR
jgi:SAM-dependent methyltransferase